MHTVRSLVKISRLNSQTLGRDDIVCPDSRNYSHRNSGEAFRPEYVRDETGDLRIVLRKVDY